MIVHVYHIIVSVSCLLCLQIDRQLQTYLQRVEAVLGKGWENHVEGQKLKQDGDAFRSKLNTQQLFEDWKKRVESRQQAVQGRIFNIVSSRTRSGTILKLQVNFAPETITLAKEVRSCTYTYETISTGPQYNAKTNYSGVNCDIQCTC